MYSNTRLKAVTKISHARLLAIAINSAMYLNENERKKIIEQWERTTFRIYGLCKKDSRTRVGDYVSLACRISTKELTYNEIMKELKDIGSHKEFNINQAAEDLENEDCYNGWEEELRYFLYRYEEYLSKENGIGINEAEWAKIWNSSTSDTVEHIYPQSENDSWKGSFRGCKKSLTTNRLGNLILLPKKLNSQCGDKSFNEKKIIYTKSGLLSVKDITSLEDWNLEKLIKREKHLIEWAKSIWNDID